MDGVPARARHSVEVEGGVHRREAPRGQAREKEFTAMKDEKFRKAEETSYEERQERRAEKGSRGVRETGRKGGRRSVRS